MAVKKRKTAKRKPAKRRVKPACSSAGSKLKKRRSSKAGKTLSSRTCKRKK